MLKYGFIFLIYSIVYLLAEVILNFASMMFVNIYIIPHYVVEPLSIIHIFILAIPLSLFRVITSFDGLDKATKKALQEMGNIE